MTRKLLNNVEFKMLLNEALELGIDSAWECGHIKCLADKIQAFYNKLSKADKDKNLEILSKLIKRIKKFIIDQKMIEDIEFKKFNDNILAESKSDVLKFIDEYNEQEETRGPQMG